MAMTFRILSLSPGNCSGYLTGTYFYGCQWMPVMDSKNTYILNEISKILKKSDCQSILTLKLTKRRMIFFQSLEMPTRGDMFIHVHRNNFSPLTFWPILQTNVRLLAPTDAALFPSIPRPLGKGTSWNPSVKIQIEIVFAVGRMDWDTLHTKQQRNLSVLVTSAEGRHDVVCSLPAPQALKHMLHT